MSYWVLFRVVFVHSSLALKLTASAIDPRSKGPVRAGEAATCSLRKFGQCMQNTRYITNDEATISFLWHTECVETACKITHRILVWTPNCVKKIVDLNVCVLVTAATKHAHTTSGMSKPSGVTRRRAKPKPQRMLSEHSRTADKT